jgi:lysM domain protein
MFKSKRELTERRMPTAEEFASWGAYELSFEELLEVNGGKREKKEKSEKSSGGGKSSKSSGGGGGSSKGFFGSGSKKSSGGGTKSKETNKEKKNKTQTGTTGTEGKKNGSGTSAGGGLKGGEPKSKEEKKSGGAEYTVQKGDTLSDIVRKQYPGASKEEIVRRVKEAAANSGIKDIDKIEPGQKILFEKPAQSSSGGEPVKHNKREGKAPIAGGTAGGGTSRERWTSSGRGSLWGGGRESGYRPETGVRTGGGQPLSENKAQTGMRQEGGMQNTETQDVRSKISGFFDRLWNKFGNVNKTNAESYLGKSRGGNWQSKENFPAPTVQGSKPSSEGYVPPTHQEKENALRPSTKAIREEADKYTHHPYVKGENEFRCDNYVEAVIRDSGLNPLDFLAGAATKKNVEEHIANAQEKGFALKSERYKPQNLEDGVYIVLMNKSDKNFNAHAGMIFQEGGKTEYRDNSSCNIWQDNDGVKFEGGVIQQDYSDLGAFQADYGYNDFYYIRIN